MAGEPSQAPARLLIVRLSAVGDVVHALPALDALRHCYPEATIGWVAHPGPAALLEGHPQLDHLFKLSRPRGAVQAWRALQTLRTELQRTGPWDVAIDFQGLTKSGVVAAVSGARRRLGFAGPASRELNALFMTQRVRPQAVPVIEMNLELVAALDCRAPDPHPQLVAHPEDEEVIQRWAAQAGGLARRFFVLDPFAGWPTKQWRRERWVAVARAVGDAFGLEALVFFGPGERPEAEHLAELIRQAGAPATVAPDTTLRQCVALLRRHAALFAGGDTGPMHIAAALGVPTVALFGSSDSRRNAPVFSGANFEVLQDFSQPCAGTFWRKCPHHEPGACLDGITVDAVLQAAERVLARTPR
jgi:heptosyltransferase-1